MWQTLNNIKSHKICWKASELNLSSHSIWQSTSHKIYIRTIFGKLANWIISPSWFQISNPWHLISQISMAYLVEYCSISIANALEILQSCTKPSILFSKNYHRCCTVQNYHINHCSRQFLPIPPWQDIQIWNTVADLLNLFLIYWYCMYPNIDFSQLKFTF